MSAFVINSYAFGEDPDAKAYLDAVETADTQALEAGVRKAVDDFVRGCKADGIWSAIKASCILAGARTLDGALVPLVGTAPTNNNFVSGDYDRDTGLLGNGSTKYLDSNRNNNADPQNSNHNSVYASSFNGNNFNFMGAADTFNESGANSFGLSGATNVFSRSRSSTGVIQSTTASSPTFVGLSRLASNNYIVRANGVNTTTSTTSQTPSNRNVMIFARTTSASALSRLAFYSIGEALDLADLDTRVSTLMTDLAAAIP